MSDSSDSSHQLVETPFEGNIENRAALLRQEEYPQVVVLRYTSWTRKVWEQRCNESQS